MGHHELVESKTLSNGQIVEMFKLYNNEGIKYFWSIKNHSEVFSDLATALLVAYGIGSGHFKKDREKNY